MDWSEQCWADGLEEIAKQIDPEASSDYVSRFVKVPGTTDGSFWDCVLDTEVHPSGPKRSL